MQPTSSGVNSPPQIERTALPNRVAHDDSAATIRVDAPDSSGFIKAPHGPVSPVRSGTGRVRGERPKSNPALTETDEGLESTYHGTTRSNQSSAAFAAEGFSVPAEHTQAEQGAAEQGAADDLSSELNWSVLHAEDIARVLDQRLFEVERREKMLNRRASQISQQERMFRLWANDTRFELEKKRRELQQFESELIQRSHDLRWLLVHGDQFHSGELAANSDAQRNDFDCVRNVGDSQQKHRQVGVDPNLLEEELQSQIRDLEFGNGKDGVRRLNR